ncbi:MAG: hypothetical protein C0469_08330 [Cyanobacteria bacterium DS2.3.42]|nr:hypothetical protein [Cyanobacteria bacterium DS2.3.42]
MSQAQSPSTDFGVLFFLFCFQKVMIMVDTGLIIKSDKDGLPTLMFKTDAREILPPETHEERMEWVRTSFSRFYSRVSESDFAYQSRAAAALTRF